MPPAVRVSVFECANDKFPDCHSRAERVEGSDPPGCGQLHTDVQKNRFPDGHWVRITTEHFESHGPMRFVESLDVNPFQRQVDERELLRAKRVAQLELQRTRPWSMSDCDPED